MATICRTTPRFLQTINRRYWPPFQMREDDLTAILSVAKVIDGGHLRLININTDALNLANLSTIYRYVMLAKALKMRITDLCKLIDLFKAAPFSTWDIDNEQFNHIVPKDTYRFCQLADSIKKAGFKTEVLEYILKGTLPADSKAGLEKTKVLQTAKTIRDTFSAIEQSHPAKSPSPLTAEILSAKLALTFQPQIVHPFHRHPGWHGILPDRHRRQSRCCHPRCSVAEIFLRKRQRPADLQRRHVRCRADHTERACEYQRQIQERRRYTPRSARKLYRCELQWRPEQSRRSRRPKLLGPSCTGQSPRPWRKNLANVYERFIPILKRKLRRDAIAQHVAALIGLSEAASSVLIAQDVDSLITGLATEGFSATYFSDVTWTTSVLARTDETVDFTWGAAAPDPAVPAKQLQHRAGRLISSHRQVASTRYVWMWPEADEIFKLYLDDVLILEKTSADTSTSWEYETVLNAAQMHVLRLEYAETSQTASVRLQWMTTTTAPEVVPALVAYPGRRPG